MNGNKKTITDMYGKSMRTTQMIPIYDSAWFYNWDTPMNNWSTPPYERIMNVTYDVSNNLTGFTILHLYGGTYINDSKYIMTYSGHNLTSRTTQNWDGSMWVNYSKTTTTYDVHNNELVNSQFEWDGSSYVEHYRETFTYDANSNMLLDEIKSWISNALQNDYMYAYTYLNNWKASTTSSSWNGSSYDNDWYESYTYDVYNNLITSVRQYWDGTSFVNNQRITNTYNGNNKLLTSLREYWNTYSSTYDNDMRTTNTYNGSGDLLTSIEETWDGFNYVNYYRSVYSYDSNHNQTYRLSQGWNATASSFINDFLELMAYDNYGFITSDSYKSFDTDGNSVLFGDSLVNYFHVVAGLNEPGNSNVLNVFPNPASGEVRIANAERIEQVNLFNSLGQIQAETKSTGNKSEISMDISMLKPGLYFLRMKSGSEMIVRKFIKE